MRPSRHPGGTFASAGEGIGAPSDPAVRDQAVSARPGVPSGVLISRFPRAAREPNPADRGGRDHRGRPGHPARSTRGRRRRGPRARRFTRRRTPAGLVGAGLTSAHDPLQHGQDALRDAPDGPDVRSPSSHRRVAARGASGRRERCDPTVVATPRARSTPDIGASRRRSGGLVSVVADPSPTDRSR
jgi:hypothetical protein